jgi:hypothetical protein
MAIAAPASPLDGPCSQALVDASRVLQLVHESMMAAKAVYDAAADKADQWERDNPQPKSRKGIKRWLRKARAVSDELTRQPFLDLLEEERVFAMAQLAFAKVKPADERDLVMMAAHAVIYDEVSLTGPRNQNPISRVVAFYLLKFRLPGMNT